MLRRGVEISVVVEKPVAGGVMLARHDGRVVLITGAIPGERVVVRVDDVRPDVIYGTTTQVLEPSPDRRPVQGDPACGGMRFAHIAYPRQVALKAEIVADAFARIAGVALPAPLTVVPSPERGYRLRARLHVRGGRVGFFREGSQRLCDAAATGQLSPGTTACLPALARWVRRARPVRIREVDVAESLAGDQRVVHLGLERGTDPQTVAGAADLPGVDGVTAGVPGEARVTCLAGYPWVSDPVEAFAPGHPIVAGHGRLRRHAASFFQANRAIVPALVARVLDAVDSGAVVDLYAGVGLFAVVLAAAGRGPVEAVESDPLSAADLAANAASLGGAVSVACTTVEAYLAQRQPRPATFIVDPPRAGLSKAAVAGLLAQRPQRIVYVSCDVATFARDVRRLREGGYALTALDGFDMFPGTPHVELVGVFT